MIIKEGSKIIGEGCMNIRFRLKRNTLTVLRAISNSTPEERRALPVTTIAERAGLSVRPTKTHLKMLRLWEYIEVDRTDRPYGYSLNPKAYEELQLADVPKYSTVGRSNG